MTGAGGFVGARLVMALRDAGWRTRALEHRAPCMPADERTRGDIADEETCARAVAGVRAVFHCAARVEPKGETEALAINRTATLTLARAARDAGAGTFVFLSSQTVLGAGAGERGPLDETAPCTPQTIYARSKLAAERALTELDAGPMRIVILRPPLVYGPGERRSFLALTRAAAGGLPSLGRGDNRLSFCHVENLTAAMLFVATDERARGVLHVADPRPVTLREALDTIARAAGSRRLPGHVPLRLARRIARGAELAFAGVGRRAPLDRPRLDTLTLDRPLDTSALRALGFVPPVEFDEGVGETVARFREDGVL